MCQSNSIFQKKICIRINELRKLHKLTYQELALRSDIEKSNLIRIINQSKNPTIKTLYKIAKGLNVRIDELCSFCKTCQECNFGCE